MSIMAAHRIPYAASLSIAHPDDFAHKISTALLIKGMRFLLLHSPCPTGWKAEPADSIELVRLAVASSLFPLYEVFDGATYKINVEPDGSDPAEYFHRQGRFEAKQIDLGAARRACSERMQRLRALAEQYPSCT